MEIFDILSIINLLLLGAITIWHCFRKEVKAVICNIAILIFFILIRSVETHYVTIRTNLYYMLGEDHFETLKQLLSAVLFFGTSITIGVQFISEIVTLVILAFLVSKVTAIFAKKASTDVFSSMVKPENDDANKHNIPLDKKSLFLVYGRLLN